MVAVFVDVVIRDCREQITGKYMKEDVKDRNWLIPQHWSMGVAIGSFLGSGQKKKKQKQKKNKKKKTKTKKVKNKTDWRKCKM